MKNITVSIDEDTYRRARIKAAEADTSVSALVRDYLVRLAGGAAADRASEFDRLLREERELRARLHARGDRFSAADRLSREQVHERIALR